MLTFLSSGDNVLSMKLAEYLRRNDIRRKPFAERIGVGIVTVNRICASAPYRPSFELAGKIHRATFGVVTYADLGFDGVVAAPEENSGD